jgi:hypothetical protein
VVAPLSVVPVLYLIMKRSTEASAVKLLVFIIVAVSIETVLELAALAAAATSARFSAAGVASADVPLLVFPPQAVNASERERQAVPASARFTLTFDHLGLSLLIARHSEVGSLLRLFVCIFLVHPSCGLSIRFAAIDVRFGMPGRCHELFPHA